MAHQYLLTQADVTIAVGGLGSAVTIPALAQQWTSQGVTCLEVAFGAPEFASVSQRSAWVGSGLSVSPLKAQPQGFCSQNILGGGAFERPSGSPTHSPGVLPLGLGVVDVGALPTDPSTLARGLESGSGPMELGVAPGSVGDAAFERALILLRSPKLGETTAFQRALLRAIPLLHGVVRLGGQRTALGDEGVGFTTGRGPGRPVVVLDARTGKLLEAKNVAAGTLYFSVVALSFWNPYAKINKSNLDPGAVSLTMVGFNPLGKQSVVDNRPPYGFPM